ncbi:hypothetical protein TNCT_503681 [Trichonephila clavata]|uniref:Uncharacterized protein n=1 Tax=Trichonephila clavata TaxID=2740835 RepID=A0A8X6KQR5_TRICU|nr:hypothetical protein TNCT_503681 [Trichonephila clavata]
MRPDRTVYKSPTIQVVGYRVSQAHLQSSEEHLELWALSSYGLSLGGRCSIFNNTSTPSAQIYPHVSTKSELV